MKQKYLLAIFAWFIASKVNGQLALSLYQTIGEDTSIQCIDAANAYNMSATEIWIGTDKGLFNFSSTSKTFYDSFNSPLPDNNITAVDVGNDQSYVWVGSNHGICRIEIPGLSWTCFNSSNSSLVSDSITSIIAMNYDSVWIGTRQGLVLYRSINDTFEVFTTANSLLRGNHIQCLERYFFVPNQNSLKPLYVGTDSGVAIIHGSDWKVYTTTNSQLTSNDIRSLAIGGYFDSVLSIWIASYGGGIINLEDTTWSFYNTANQLIKSDSVDFIEHFVNHLGSNGSAGSGEITGSKNDSVFLNLAFDDFLTVQQDISNPRAATSINRANGAWLWLATSNEIYRGDYTVGITNISLEIPKWKPAIDGKYLFLSLLPLSNDEMTLKIYDVNGKLFFEKQFVNHSSSSQTFDIPDLSKGTYLVQLLQSNKIETLKVIKAN